MFILPFYVAIAFNPLVGLLTYVIIEYIFYKLIEGPVIALVSSYIIRVLMYLALLYATLVGIGFIGVTYFGLDLGSIPFFKDFFESLSDAITAFKNYV